jgi:alkylation response protein AidB-like acyl-CoA dehydrogenase
MPTFALSDEQLQLQATARAFAQREIGPITKQIRAGRAVSGPQRNSPWSHVRPVFAKAAELGFLRLLIPEAYGGLGGSVFDHALVMEEFGAVDHGIAASWFNISATAPVILAAGGDAAQKARWLSEIAAADDYVLASASSEPDVAGGDSFYPGDDPQIGLRAKAVRDGETWVLSGRKSGFSTNAGAARLYFVMARTALDRPARESTSMFLVPADTRGLSLGSQTRLIGWDGAMQGEVLLEDVRLPRDHLVGGEGGNQALFFMRALPVIACGLAATFVGLARTAFETAFSYAQERRSWGVPISAHPNVAIRLADMATELEAARMMVWRLADAADRGLPDAGWLAPAAKSFAVEVAIRNAERAIKTLGSYGVTEDYGLGRMLADGWIGDCCDGTHDMLRLSITRFLEMTRFGPPPGAGPPPPGAKERPQ